MSHVSLSDSRRDQAFVVLPQDDRGSPPLAFSAGRAG